MKKIIISVTNDLITDQRVHKVATSLHNKGHYVLLIGKNGDPICPRKYNLHRFKVFFSSGFLFYLEFNVKLFCFLLFKKFDILLANDLDTLLSNLIVSKIRRKKIVYDSHELFSEVPELNKRPFVKNVWLMIEMVCLPNIIYSYTVSPSIAKYYHKKYGSNMSVIRNFPIYRIKKSNESNNKIKKIIYQGAINKDRGIELMIESMVYVDAVLWIIGSGDIIQDIISKVTRLSLENKVKFVGKVHYDALFDITNTCDLGLSFEEDTCLAYRYSLPNKIFDYINAEIPVLISDLPEFKKVINKFNIGMCLSSRKPVDVACQINKILSMPKEYWHQDLKSAKKVFCWKKQEKALLDFF